VTTGVEQAVGGGVHRATIPQRSPCVKQAGYFPAPNGGVDRST
jgi:hypothetical protein